LRICLHTLWPVDPYFVGGTERFLVDTAKSLTRYGFDAFILCSNTTHFTRIESVPVVGCIPSEYASLIVSYRNDPRAFIAGELYGKPASKQSVLALSNYVQAQLQSVSFDIVHLNTFSGSLYRNPPENAVLTIHENPSELDRFWHEGSFEELCRMVSSGIVSPPLRVFTPTAFYAELYTDLLQHRVECLPIGVPWTNVGPIPDRGAQKERRILLPARLYPPQKGQDILIEALGLLREQGFEFVATMTGADERYNLIARELEHRLNQLELRKFVTIKRTNSIAEEFKTHDILASPEQYCSYGISAREAAAMGLKLVISDIPPHREMNAENVQTFYFVKDDPVSCAAALAKAFSSPHSPVADHIRFRLNNDFDAFTKSYARNYLELIDKSR
jgi:glycosyltransferase involved in cell wall biosynthesis